MESKCISHGGSGPPVYMGISLNRDGERVFSFQHQSYGYTEHFPRSAALAPRYHSGGTSTFSFRCHNPLPEGLTREETAAELQKRIHECCPYGTLNAFRVTVDDIGNVIISVAPPDAAG